MMPDDPAGAEDRVARESDLARRGEQANAEGAVGIPVRGDECRFRIIRFRGKRLRVGGKLTLQERKERRFEREDE